MMMKKSGLRPLAIAAGIALLAPSAFADGLDYHGYFRVQGGTTSKGGNLQCFQGTWPVAKKYRLGNECDNYTEHTIGLGFGDTNAVWGKFKTTFAVQMNGSQDWEAVGGADNQAQIANRETYLAMGGMFPNGAMKNATVWVGKRFYNRHDVHMNDYYFWENSGVGAGIEEIGDGPVKFAFAYMQKGANAQSSATALTGKRYSLRAYNIDVNPGGKLEGELVLINDSAPQGSATKGSGSALMIEHTQSGVAGGWNKLSLTLGKDSGHGQTGVTYSGGGVNKGDSLQLIDHLYFDIKGTGWTGTATAVYSEIKDEGKAKQTWISAGIRPVYNFTDNTAIAVEAGYDQGKDTNGVTGKLAKLTVAPQLSLARGVWARPVLRAYATYAKWNGGLAAQTSVANGAFGTAKDGMTFGVQAEAWW